MNFCVCTAASCDSRTASVSLAIGVQGNHGFAEIRVAGLPDDVDSSVAGVKQIELIGAGVVLRTESFRAASQQVHVDFPLTTQSRTWYSLIVDDNQGHKAYTDPIWVDAVACFHLRRFNCK